MTTARRAVVPERCNIGPAEISRRRRMAVAISALTVAFVALAIGAHWPIWVRLLALPLASASGVAWLQVFRRFCVRFGALGLENFGALGGERSVERDVRRADARRALGMILEGILFGVAVSAVVLVVPS